MFVSFLQLLNELSPIVVISLPKFTAVRFDAPLHKKFGMISIPGSKLMLSREEPQNALSALVICLGTVNSLIA